MLATRNAICDRQSTLVDRQSKRQSKLADRQTDNLNTRQSNQTTIALCQYQSMAAILVGHFVSAILSAMFNNMPYVTHFVNVFMYLYNVSQCSCVCV